MCGIVGVIGGRPAAPLLLDALRRLEYRGYDSAGIATLVAGRIERRRAPGKLDRLAERLEAEPLGGITGIGHTRWATHGVPNETNAHPHVSDGVALVHNGIIENFLELRAELVAHGHSFSTQTDTEVVAHLVASLIRQGLAPREAAARAVRRLQGAFALAILFEGQGELLVVARKGCPLAIGYGDNEMFVGSDALALAPLTERIQYLEEGDIALPRPQGCEDRRRPGPAGRAADPADRDERCADRQGQSPPLHGKGDLRAAGRAGRHAALLRRSRHAPDRPARAALRSGRGHAHRRRRLRHRLLCLPDRQVLVRDPGRPAGRLGHRVASSATARRPWCRGRWACSSRSPARPPTRWRPCATCRAAGHQALAVVNVPESTLAREADGLLRTLAGPEIGVASTKAFTTQLATLACLAIGTARARGRLTPEREEELTRALDELPARVLQVLEKDQEIRAIAGELTTARDVLYLGRGTSYAVALEGALKLKEISYIHAEAYAAGELKHGPIALIDDNVPVIVVAPRDHLFEKTASNLQEVVARGGRVVLLSDAEGVAQLGQFVWRSVVLPSVDAFVAPILYAIPVQLLAYHTAVLKGTDVDQPRNLAKSVTVE